jgi:hypothetical protein
MMSSFHFIPQKRKFKEMEREVAKSKEQIERKHQPEVRTSVL